MPYIKICPLCNGEKIVQELISIHDDRTHLVTCPNCNGEGVISELSIEEENDYHNDWWI